MPAYLVHGFRWPRISIRRHIIYNNIDAAAPEYIGLPQTSDALRENLCNLYGDIMKSLPELHFVEQYDPDDTSKRATSQPYAFVADKVETIHLSLDATKAMCQGVSANGWNALVDLKERLAPGEEVGWWVVHNGDVMRSDTSGRESVGQQGGR